MKAQTVT